MKKAKLIYPVIIATLLMILPAKAQDVTYGKVKVPNAQINAVNTCISHHNKGIAWMEAGYPLHAIDEFKIALMLNPNSTMSATVYNNLGRAYEMIRKYDLAIMSYQHAIRINPDFSVYYKNLINAYNAKNSLSAAQTDYEKIIKLNSQDAPAWFILGLIYMKKGNNAKAITAFNSYIKLEPRRDLASAAKKYINQLNPSN